MLMTLDLKKLSIQKYILLRCDAIVDVAVGGFRPRALQTAIFHEGFQLVLSVFTRPKHHNRASQLLIRFLWPDSRGFIPDLSEQNLQPYIVIEYIKLWATVREEFSTHYMALHK
jgi:hypothetical protein